MGRRNLRSVGGGAPSSLGENVRAKRRSRQTAIWTTGVKAGEEWGAQGDGEVRAEPNQRLVSGNPSGTHQQIHD